MYTYKHTTQENGVTIEECWYDSSNVFYSKLEDKEESLKLLTIVFKNGATYVYQDVNVYDYIAFRDAESSGKGFNANIACKDSTGKVKYQFKRVSDIDIKELNTIKESYINGEIKLDVAKDVDIYEPGCIELITNGNNVTVSIGNTKIKSEDCGNYTVFTASLLSALNLNFKSCSHS